MSSTASRRERTRSIRLASASCPTGSAEYGLQPEAPAGTPPERARLSIEPPRPRQGSGRQVEEARQAACAGRAAGRARPDPRDPVTARRKSERSDHVVVQDAEGAGTAIPWKR